jgi:hypothetical protein
VYLEQRLTGELVFADGHNRPFRHLQTLSALSSLR